MKIVFTKYYLGNQTNEMKCVVGYLTLNIFWVLYIFLIFYVK